MKKNLLLSMLVLGSLMGTANAAEVIPNYDLDPTVVTATKTEQKLLHTSADVSVITAKDIERMHYKTMTDALKSVPNVQILNYTQNYTRNKILINGDHNVIVLLNGVRISQLTSGTLSMNYGFNLIRDMSDIQRIEVLKGAASVLYGSDAKGGVINIITKEPNKTKTTISTEQGTFGHKSYGISQSIVKDKLAVTAFAKKTDDGNYRDGQGREWPYSNKTNEFGINAKLHVGKNDSGNITVNYNNSHTKSFYEDYIYRQRINSKQDLSTLQVAYEQEFNNGWNNKLTYNKNITKDQFLTRNWSKRKKEYGDPIDWGTDHLRTEIINDTVTKKFDDKNQLVFGYERITTGNMLKANKDNEASSNAAFIQYDWNFIKNWKLLAGYRHDKFKAASGKEYKANNSKSFTLTHDFDANTNAYVAYNEFFLAPNAGELFSELVGNKDLLPEKGNNKEFGINHMTKDGTLINFHFFTRHSKNAKSIEKADTSYGWQYKNSDERAHGFDLNAMKEINDKWTVKAGWAHLSIVDAGNYKMGYLPSNSITAGASYKYKKVDVGLDTRGFIGRVGKKVDYKAWPSGRYWVTDIAVNYKPIKDMKMYLKINNIFDVDYAYHTDYLWNGHRPDTWYSMPGRNIIFGMEYSF